MYRPVWRKLVKLLLVYIVLHFLVWFHVKKDASHENQDVFGQENGARYHLITLLGRVSDKQNNSEMSYNTQLKNPQIASPEGSETLPPDIITKLPITVEGTSISSVHRVVSEEINKKPLQRVQIGSRNVKSEKIC